MSLQDKINNTVFFLNKSDGQPHVGYVLHKSDHTVKIYDVVEEIIIDLDEYNNDYYFLYEEDDEIKTYLDNFFGDLKSRNIAEKILQEAEEKKQEFIRTRHMMPTPKKPPHPRKGGRKTRKRKAGRRPERINNRVHPQPTENENITYIEPNRRGRETLWREHNINIQDLPRATVVRTRDLPVGQQVIVGIPRETPRRHLIKLAKKCKNKFTNVCRTLKRVARRELTRRGGKKRKTRRKRIKKRGMGETPPGEDPPNIFILHRSQLRSSIFH